MAYFPIFELFKPTIILRDTDNNIMNILKNLHPLGKIYMNRKYSNILLR